MQKTINHTHKESIRQCVKCGMIANIDPWEHQERYKHKPAILDVDKILEHDGTGCFTIELKE